VEQQGSLSAGPRLGQHLRGKCPQREPRVHDLGGKRFRRGASPLEDGLDPEDVVGTELDEPGPRRPAADGAGGSALYDADWTGSSLVSAR
jgi:hypothetical protein